MSTPLRFGILGTGAIARKFAAQLPQCRRAVLAAVGSRSDESARRFARQQGLAAHAGYDALLADPDCDAVYVSLPNGLHCDWTIRALEAGKHVLCEKPIAANLAQAEAMFDAAQRCGRVLVEGFMYRCHPAVERVIRMAGDGTIGPLKLIRTHFTFNRPADAADVRYHADLAGGALMDVGCYCVNFARALAGSEPTDLHAISHLHETMVDDYSAGTLRFDGDVLCTFTCGMTVEADRTTYVCGSDGYLAIDFPWHSDGTFTLVKGGRREPMRVEAPMELFALEADRFAAAVLDGKPPWLTKADTLGNMRVLDELRSRIGLSF